MSLYQQSVPMFIKYLKNLSALLKKGEEFADMKGMKHKDFLNSRLYPDMFGYVANSFSQREVHSPILVPANTPLLGSSSRSRHAPIRPSSSPSDWAASRRSR